MADDIDDILASVDRDTRTDADYFVPEATAVDHQVLTRFWVAERGAPEVLPWPGKLMERVMERVRRQIATIEDLSLSAEESSSAASNAANLNLKLCILQSDLSRTQYLIRSLLRQRLAKLTKYSLHYLRLSAPEYSATGSSQSQSQQRQEPNNTLLSAEELSFLRSHHSLLAEHYSTSFLSGFPPALRRLDDNAGGTSMVAVPETKEVVFVRCLSESVRIVVPSDETAAAGAGLPPAPGSGWPKQEVLGYGATMRKGEVWVVRWEGVREAWEKGDVEIL